MAEKETKTDKRPFTVAMLHGLKGTGKPYVVWAKEAAGLGVRVSADGKTKTLFIQMRVDGRQVKMGLGRVEGTFDAAAKEKLLKDVERIKSEATRSGVDPRAARAAQPTVEEFWASFKKEHIERKHKDGGKIAEGLYTRFIKPKWRGRKVQDIAPADVVALADYAQAEAAKGAAERAKKSVRKSQTNSVPGATTANKLLGVLGAFFGHAVLAGVRETSPVDKVKKRSEPPRRVILRGDELPKFIAALAQYEAEAPAIRHASPVDAADAIRLLLVSGARKMEILSLEWTDIDLDAKRWVKPAVKNKTGVEQTIVLNAAAIAVLRRVRARRDAERPHFRDAAYVFPSRKPYRGRVAKHIADIGKPFAKVLAVAGIDRHVTPHDLRRTFASALRKLGVTAEDAMALTGHASPATLVRTYRMLDEIDSEAKQREASDGAANLLLPAGD